MVKEKPTLVAAPSPAAPPQPVQQPQPVAPVKEDPSNHEKFVSSLRSDARRAFFEPAVTRSQMTYDWVDRGNLHHGANRYRVGICVVAGDLFWAVAVTRPRKMQGLRYSHSERHGALKAAVGLMVGLGSPKQPLRHYEGVIHVTLKALTEEEKNLYRLVGGG